MLPSPSSPRPVARSGSRLPTRSGWPRAGALWRLAAAAGALAAGLAVMVAQAPSAPAAPGTRPGEILTESGNMRAVPCAVLC